MIEAPDGNHLGILPVSAGTRRLFLPARSRVEPLDPSHVCQILESDQGRIPECRNHLIGVFLAPKNLAGCRFAIQVVPVEMKSSPPGPGRGRPVGPAKKRINARFPESLAERIEYAAALRGVAVASFIQEAVAARAEQVIEAESRWRLTREQAAAVAAMIARPPKANKKLLEAAKLASRHVVIRD